MFVQYINEKSLHTLLTRHMVLYSKEGLISVGHELHVSLLPFALVFRGYLLAAAVKLGEQEVIKACES